MFNLTLILIVFCSLVPQVHPDSLKPEEVAHSRAPERKSITFASAIHLVPVMANNPGLFGAFFKTRVSILNVAPLNYSIQATLYNQFGKANEATIPIANGQQQNYENFLEDVFAYQEREP